VNVSPSHLVFPLLTTGIEDIVFRVWL